ncbi:FKBP-type peptidyl-prolyl cis-trans isomerase [Neptuniibacter caesariensis]|uniref:Peptidyl-prolyl cis-trans isomerase n=1 Tax=Neptuniibacter caesariensis TaxID=207954 RepID=A0A7U8C7Y1_NEPCE|nr:peptidylprolyl isomerase [Neptuniibacter caesariensis]EAR61476.1 probable peptidyl-prolyl cis-trans isomerase, FkbP-type [Oceanospirillum sp. MED92] [Neptuniibacter caesariensis]
MSKLIGPGKSVTLHFAIKLEDGQIIDSNFSAEPATFTVGDGNLLEGFEQALFGLEEGAKQTLKILPENGFGMPNPSNIQNLPRSQFDGMELEQGLVISFSDPGNGELPGVIAEFDDKMVSVDFNHPLAGKKLDFEVEILKVVDA